MLLTEVMNWDDAYALAHTKPRNLVMRSFLTMSRRFFGKFFMPLRVYFARLQGLSEILHEGKRISSTKRLLLSSEKMH